MIGSYGQSYDWQSMSLTSSATGIAGKNPQSPGNP
jgi:hypothetical protein